MNNRLTEKQRNSRANLRPYRPGESGNPGGRPKGPGLTKLLRDRLKEKAVNVPFAAELAAELGHDARKATVAEIVVDAMLKSALEGHAKMLVEILNRVREAE